MVNIKSVEKQLKKLKFNPTAWGRGEVRELPNILMEDEEIYECVNGIYDGGFALLVATNVRLLLIDKKPLNYLTVEDLRFDMINEIDYSHRLLGAHIDVSAGYKNLKFMSYNQQRLRKLIGHVQHCMAEAKKQQSDHQFDQTQHLERINQQLQAYLLAQHQQYAKLQEQLRQNEGRSQAGAADPPVRPDPHLSDYLYARSLLAKHGLAGENQLPALPGSPAGAALPPMTDQMSSAAYGHGDAHNPQLSELYAEGVQEIFGKRGKLPALPPTPTNPLEINPLRIAYSKLPMALRNRRFGRPPLAPPAVTQPFRS